jgi:hypothetical protein
VQREGVAGHDLGALEQTELLRNMSEASRSHHMTSTQLYDYKGLIAGTAG